MADEKPTSRTEYARLDAVTSWDALLHSRSIPSRDLEELQKFAESAGADGAAVLGEFCSSANSPKSIRSARYATAKTTGLDAREREARRLDTRYAIAWAWVRQQFPSGLVVGTNAATENPWVDRPGWAEEPTLPILLAPSRKDGTSVTDVVEPGYVVYNELIAERFHRPFRTGSGEPRVAVPTRHGLEIYNPSATEFPDRLGYAIYSLRGEAIPLRALKVAATTLSCRALSRELPPERVTELWVRVAPWSDGCTRVDMRDDRQRCITLGPKGWKIQEVGDPTFDPRPHMLRLPEPERAPEGDWSGVEALWEFVLLPRSDGLEDQQLLALACLVQFLIAPSTPKPVVVATGQEGIGKSTMMGFLQSAVDPSRVPLLSLPRDDEELANIAVNHAVINFDNLRSISSEVSDFLARLSTGIGLVKRQLYSDSGEIALNVRRWVILNGISAAPRAADLLRRCVFLDVQPAGRVIGSGTLEERWAKQHPRILGGLLNLAVATTRALRDEPPPLQPHTMADYVRTGQAMTTAMGDGPERFLRAWLRNVEVQHQEAAQDPWVVLLADWFGPRKPGDSPTRADSIAEWVNKDRKGTFSYLVSAQQVGQAFLHAAKTLRYMQIPVGRRKVHAGAFVYYRMSPEEVLESASPASPPHQRTLPADESAPGEAGEELPHRSGPASPPAVRQVGSLTAASPPASPSSLSPAGNREKVSGRGGEAPSELPGVEGGEGETEPAQEPRRSGDDRHTATPASPIMEETENWTVPRKDRVLRSADTSLEGEQQ